MQKYNFLYYLRCPKPENNTSLFFRTNSFLMSLSQKDRKIRIPESHVNHLLGHSAVYREVLSGDKTVCRIEQEHRHLGNIVAVAHASHGMLFQIGLREFDLLRNRFFFSAETSIHPGLMLFTLTSGARLMAMEWVRA